MRRDADGASAVTARGLGRRFGERDAVVGIDLEIPGGVCFGIFGRNGSGKTTFLSLVATLLRPTAGTIAVLGEELPRRADRVRRLLGASFERAPVPSYFTLGEALRYWSDVQGLTREGRAEATRRIDELIERFGLVWRIRDPLATFSRGMQQRVSLACALLPDPPLLLLDEPFNGLDAEGCRLVENAIVERVERGRSVILVTHDLERAARLCRHAALFDAGRVIRTFDGTSLTPAELVAEAVGSEGR